MQLHLAGHGAGRPYHGRSLPAWAATGKRPKCFPVSAAGGQVAKLAFESCDRCHYPLLAHRKHTQLGSAALWGQAAAGRDAHVEAPCYIHAFYNFLTRQHRAARCPRYYPRRATPRPDLGERWPSGLVATQESQRCGGMKRPSSLLDGRRRAAKDAGIGLSDQSRCASRPAATADAARENLRKLVRGAS
jgi:hypothetical protein